METVLNIGLTDASVKGLAEQSGNPRFEWDPTVACCRCSADGSRHRWRTVRARARYGQGREGHHARPRSGRQRPRCSRRPFQGDHPRRHGCPVPAGPGSSSCVSRPSRCKVVERRSRRALPPSGAHPRRHRHRGERVLHGVRQPRQRLRHRCRVHSRPVHGQVGVYGDYLQTRRVRTSSRVSATTLPLQELERIDSTSYAQLTQIMATLEAHYRDCATSSSRSSAARCGCCRTASASERPRPRSASRAAGRRRRDRSRRALARVQRRSAREPDVHQVRCDGRTRTGGTGHGRITGCCHGPRRLRFPDGRRMGGAR